MAVVNGVWCCSMTGQEASTSPKPWQLWMVCVLLYDWIRGINESKTMAVVNGVWCCSMTGQEASTSPKPWQLWMVCGVALWLDKRHQQVQNHGSCEWCVVLLYDWTRGINESKTMAVVNGVCVALWLDKRHQRVQNHGSCEWCVCCSMTGQEASTSPKLQESNSSQLLEQNLIPKFQVPSRVCFRGGGGGGIPPPPLEFFLPPPPPSSECRWLILHNNPSWLSVPDINDFFQVSIRHQWPLPSLYQTSMTSSKSLPDINDLFQVSSRHQWPLPSLYQTSMTSSKSLADINDLFQVSIRHQWPLPSLYQTSMTSSKSLSDINDLFQVSSRHQWPLPSLYQTSMTSSKSLSDINDLFQVSIRHQWPLPSLYQTSMTSSKSLSDINDLFQISTRHQWLLPSLYQTFFVETQWLSSLIMINSFLPGDFWVVFWSSSFEKSFVLRRQFLQESISKCLLWRSTGNIAMSLLFVVNSFSCAFMSSLGCWVMYLHFPFRSDTRGNKSWLNILFC